MQFADIFNRFVYDNKQNCGVFMIFGNLSLRSKMLALLIPFGLLYCAAVAYFFFDTSDALIDNSSLDEEKKNSIMMQQTIKDFQNKALTIATIFAKNDNVPAAYSYPNEEQGSDFLKSAIKPMISEILTNKEIKDFQIHYHKAPAKSFLRSWTKKRFDDLSKFRPTILEVSSSQRPLKAIEFGVGGFAIRGLAPIFSNGAYLGSVEFLYDIKDVLQLLTTDTTTTDMFNIVVAETAENALKPDQIKKFYAKRIGNFFLSKPSSDWINQEELLSEDVLAEMNNSKNVIIKQKGNIFYSLNPLTDLYGKTIGYVAFVKNNEELIQKQMNDIYFKVGIIVLLVLIFVGGIILVVDRIIIQPVRVATKIANEVSKGNFSSILKD